MQFLIALLAATVAESQSAATSPRVVRTDAVLVRSVLDGDTIAVAGVGTVRLLGIDAPEVSHGLDSPEPFGREAKERLASLVLNRWVRLEMEGPRLDVYNRHLAYVMTEDGQFINAVLVRDGLARVSAREPIARLAELRRAEADAQAARRGMWGATPSIPARSAHAPAIRVRKPDASAHRPRKGGASGKHY
jgi:endonuclease YncB( thermonuclease family)